MERSKRVRLTSEWMGNKKGTVINLPLMVARQLVARGAAELESEVKPAGKLQRRDQDKMVKSSINK